MHGVLCTPHCWLRFTMGSISWARRNSRLAPTLLNLGGGSKTSQCAWPAHFWGSLYISTSELKKINGLNYWPFPFPQTDNWMSPAMRVRRIWVHVQVRLVWHYSLGSSNVSHCSVAGATVAHGSLYNFTWTGMAWYVPHTDKHSVDAFNAMYSE